MGENVEDAALRLIPLIDLTLIDRQASPDALNELCRRASTPDVQRPHGPTVAAVCVHHQHVSTVRTLLHDNGGSTVKIAAACGNFPAGDGSAADKLADVSEALEQGVDELDYTANWRKLAAGELSGFEKELLALTRLAGATPVKLILETGEIGDSATIVQVAEIAYGAGIAMTKTSTGTRPRGATVTDAALLLAVAAHHPDRPGVKVSGGIVRADQADRYLTLATTIGGSEYSSPDRMRIGASRLLDALTRRHATQPASDAPGSY
jgi:deoxyribose-phosphate aldolase